jgi:hypothetical protein
MLDARLRTTKRSRSKCSADSITFTDFPWQEKLTADQRIVRDLLKYKEGLEEIEKWMTKEHSVENLLCVSSTKTARISFIQLL